VWVVGQGEETRRYTDWSCLELPILGYLAPPDGSVLGLCKGQGLGEEAGEGAVWDLGGAY